MAEKTIRTRHLISGQIDENTPLNIFEHPVLGAALEQVGPDAKPFLPEMHKSPDLSVGDAVAIPDIHDKVEPVEVELEFTQLSKPVDATPKKNGKD